MGKYPPIQIVNENDEPTGAGTMDEAHRDGLFHQIVVVILKDENGRLLLQLRNPAMVTNPNMWDASAAGHVDHGEDYLAAAERELEEELGLKNVKLTEADYFKSTGTYEWRKLNRFKKVYLGTIPAGQALAPNPEEVSAVKWYTKRELNDLIAAKPDQIVKDFVDIVKRLNL